MATKVIKLQDNNNNTLIPVTDASVVQMSVDGQVKSVKDVILEDEEVTAAGYNELNSRLESLENIDFSNFSTERVHVIAGREILSGTTAVSLGTVPAGAHFLHVEGTGSSANYGISIVWGSDTYEFNSSSDGTLHGDAHYEAASHTQNATAVATVSGTPAADTRIIVIIYDKTNELVSYVGQVAVTNDYNDLNNKPTIPSLSKGTTSGSGNAVTDISVSGHTITLTKGSTFLTSQSKDFGKVQTVTDATGTDGGTTTKGTMNADAVKDVLQVKGGNKWITTGVSNTTAESTSDTDILVINHALTGAVTNGTSGTATVNASGATAAWGIDVVKGVTMTYDAAGHITGLSVTSGKVPSQPVTSIKTTDDNTWIQATPTTASTGAVTIDIQHIGPGSGSTKNATKGTDGAQLTHNSSMVMTGINWKADGKGHVTEISYTLAKLPADNNTHLTSYNIVGSSTGMVNSAQSTNGNVYLRHIEGSDSTWTARSTHKISGSAGIKATSDSSGNITIAHTNTIAMTPTDAVLTKIKYDTQGHITADEPVSTGMMYIPYKTDAADLDSTWLASIGTAGTATLLVENTN